MTDTQRDLYNYQRAQAKARAERKKEVKKLKGLDTVSSQKKRRAETLKWRAERKAQLLGEWDGAIVLWCVLGEHWMFRDEVELCHGRCSGMRGDGDTIDNTFLGCHNGNTSQGSVELDKYLELPLAIRRKNCGVGQ